MKRHLQCAEHQVSRSNLTNYCACHTEWLACLIVVTCETSFTMRGASSLTIQPHQILRLPHRMARVLDCRHIWNVIYNARSNRCHHQTSPNTAPATQNDSHAWSSSHMKRHLQRGEQQVSPSNLTKYCACHTEWLTCLILVTYETSFTVRGASGVTIQPHELLRLPRRMTRMLDRRHIWNVFYNARSNKCHHPTSPNTAPATQNGSRAWLSSHMKRHLQCAEQQVSPSNLTKYRACHTEWLACLIVVTYETSFPMRGATGITIQPHEIPRLPHKMTRKLDRRHIWNLISNARSNRYHDPTSRTTAPATQNDSHAWSSSHMKRLLQCAEQQVSPSNLTKYCACHTEWLACLIVVTYETSFTMRGATGVTIKPHQIPRLPHKMTRMLDRRHIWNLISNAGSNWYHDPTSPNTAPGTNNDTARFQRKSPKTDETSFPMRGRSEHDPSMIRAWSEHDPSMIRAWSDHENANRNPPRKWACFSRSPEAFSIVKYNVSPPILHSNLHQILRLPQKDTLDLHQVLHLPRKVTLELHQVLRLPRKMTSSTSASIAPATNSDTWTSASTAPATKSDTWTSPSTAPATVL